MTLARRPRWRFGINRWWVLLFIVLGVVAAAAWPPIRPHVQLPAEVLSAAPLITLPLVGPIYLTNTLVALLLADVILLGLALAVRRSPARGKMVLGGMSGALEQLVGLRFPLPCLTPGWTTHRRGECGSAIVLLVLV